MPMTVSELQVVVSADTSKAETGLSALGSKLGSAGSALATAFGGAAIAGIAGLTAGLGASVAAAANFEQAMSAIKAVSGATAPEMEQLSALALQLGADTSFSASEAAAGIGELVKAGVSVGDVIGGGAAAALNLAAAGGLSVAESAEIASNAMNVFSLKGADVGHVADVIAGAANASAIDVHDFGMSLAASGAVAATVGIGFDDLGTAIAVMGQAGIKGSDAGTSLKTMLLNLSPSTDKARTAMQELGIITADGSNQFFDATGKAKSLAEISGVLQTATAGLTEQQKLQALQTIFGTDAIRAAAIMAKAGAEGFDTMAESIGKVTAETVAAERLNNLKGDVEQLTGSLETAAIKIGTAFLPGLRSIVQGSTEIVNQAAPILEQFAKDAAAAITEASRQIQDAWRTVKQALAGDWAPSDKIDPFVNAVGQAALVVKDLGDTIATAAQKAGEQGAWDAFATGMSNLSDTVAIANDKINEISAALERAGGPAGDVASAADLLAGAIRGAGLGFQYASMLIADFVDSVGTGIAVLIDLTTGLSQTGEALNLLKQGNIPGAIAALDNAGVAFGAAALAAEDFRQRGLLAVRDEATVMASVVGVGMAGVTTATETNMAASVAAVEAAAPQMSAAAESGASGAVAAVAAQQGPAAAAGQGVGDSIGSGMMAGITSWVGSIASAAANLVSSAIAAARGEADARSPSKKTQKLGEDLAEGLEIGLSKSGLGDEMIAQIRNFIAASRDYIPVAGQIARAEREIKDIRYQSQTEALVREQEMIDVTSEMLRLKEAQVRLERDQLPLRQDLARASREVADIERGSLPDRTALIEMDGQRKQLRLQEIDLEKQLIGLAQDDKRRKQIQEQIDKLRDQDRALGLEADRIQTTNQLAAIAARTRREGLDDQNRGYQTVIDTIKDQIETLGAEQAVFQANENVIKNATDNEVKYRERLIAVFTAEGKPLKDRIEAGLALVGQLEKEGRISKELADRLRDVAKEAGAGSEKTGMLGQAAAEATPELDAAARKAKEMADQAARIADSANDASKEVIGLSQSLQSLGHVSGGSFVFNFGQRARGGAVTAGMPYVVGERRPELFVPERSGTILPAVPSSFGATGAAMQTVRVEVAIGGRVAEEIYVTGRELAIRRGRVTA